MSRCIRLKGLSLAETQKWIGRLARMLPGWNEQTRSDACIVARRVKYPIELNWPKGVVFRGIQSCEIRLKAPAFLADAGMAMQAGRILATSDEAILYFRGKLPDQPGEGAFAYRVDSGGRRVSCRPGIEWRDPEGYKNALRDFFRSMRADVEIEDVGEGIRFVPRHGARIEVLSSNEKGQTGQISLYRPEREPGELFQTLLEYLGQCQMKFSEVEWLFSFPFVASGKEKEAWRQVETLSKLALPAKSAKCDFYCSVESLKHLKVLAKLREMDCENGSMEQTAAKFTTPGGLPGLVVVGATKDGFVVELHAQEAPDEAEFVKEMKLLLKEHLR